jgi:Fe-S-cluster-containing hydrogenase component 2
MGKLRVSAELCTGCRSCELACSFHFARAFGRKAGAIEVRRNEAEGEFVPIIHEKATSLRKACDLCAGEEGYLCVKYCVVGAIAANGGKGYE